MVVVRKLAPQVKEEADVRLGHRFEEWLWRRVLKPVLMRLDPETAHRVTLLGLPSYVWAFYRIPAVVYLVAALGLVWWVAA